MGTEDGGRVKGGKVQERLISVTKSNVDTNLFRRGHTMGGMGKALKRHPFSTIGRRVPYTKSHESASTGWRAERCFCDNDQIQHRAPSVMPRAALNLSSVTC